MTAIDVGGLLTAVDALAPFALAEPWDNVGLMVGRRGREVTTVLVALDLRAAVLDEAASLGAQAIVLHHPPIFPALSAVSDARTMGRLVLRAAEERVAIIAAHTNLDSARGGLNDLMAHVLGMTGTTPLVPSPRDPALGLGRVGEVPTTTLGALAAMAVREFCPRTANLGLAGDPDMPVHRIAICTGSGGSLIAAARDCGARAYVTGDLKYHDFDAAEGMGLVNVPHGAVEGHVLRMWTLLLAAALSTTGVQVMSSSVDTDPWCAAC